VRNTGLSPIQNPVVTRKRRILVDPFRALQIWNGTNETLDQIASRFTDVKREHVRYAIKAAVERGLGDLARPLPTHIHAAPKALRPPREPKAPKEPRPRQPKVKAFTRENPAAPIPDDLPKAAPPNATVEHILEYARPCNYRGLRRSCDGYIVEWFEEWFAAGKTEWNGKTASPYIGESEVKKALFRKGRGDLWTKCVLAMRAWHKLSGTKRSKLTLADLEVTTAA
jgi:hypothetical protein